MIHVRALTEPLEHQALELDGDGRTVTVRVVSWDTPYRVTDDGVTYYREQFAPGGLTVRDNGRVLVRLEHDPAEMRGKARPGATRSPGVTVGRVVSTRSERDGLYADIRIAATGDGDDTLALIDDEIVTAVSGEFDDDPVTPAAGELVTRTRAELVGLAFTLHPQHGDARVLAVRSEPDEAEKGPDMDNMEQPVESAGTDTPDTPSDDTTPQHSPAPQPVAAVSHRSAPIPGAPPAAQPRQSHFRSFGDFAGAVARGELGDEQRSRYFRALAAADTDDTTGLIQVQWMGEVIDIYRTMTPTIQAFETGTLPENGLTVSQPIVGTRPTVAAQASQGAEVSSTVATITSASWTVNTFAGGQNTSLQAILRTDPSYLDSLMRLYMREMALSVNTAVATALLAAADDVNTTALEYTTAAAFDDLIIDASAVFMDTLHRPAEVVGLSVDLWKALAKADGSDGHPLYPAINPQNRSGSMNAVDATGSIRKVDWYVDPALGGVGDGVKAVIGVRDAFKTLLGPVGTLSADVPTTLGRDVAVYQFAAYGKVDAAGLYLVADAV